MSAAPEMTDASASLASGTFDLDAIRSQFPGLHQEVRGKKLIYLDSAATTQKPKAVVDAIIRAYTDDCANVHRGAYHLSERATAEFERARDSVRQFINAAQTEEIIFTRGTTESINLVAQSFGRSRIGAGEELLISAMEHHSNIVPWQLLCESTGAKLVVAPMNDRGELLIDELAALLSDKTRLVAITHVSNALGTINPVEEIISLAHAKGVPVLLDGAQAAPHIAIDVRALDCDFYAFSGHKLYGPTGIGVLYGKRELLEEMPPYQGGGEMISSVTFEKSSYAPPPHKFEAGTPHIAGAIGLGAAIDFLAGLNSRAVATHEAELLSYATEALEAVPGLRILGTAQKKTAVISFALDGVHPHDIATILDSEGIAVRAGHHCAQPVMQFFQLPASARASFGLYNSTDEVDSLLRGLARVREIFSR